MSVKGRWCGFSNVCRSVLIGELSDETASVPSTRPSNPEVHPHGLVADELRYLTRVDAAGNSRLAHPDQAYRRAAYASRVSHRMLTWSGRYTGRHDVD